MGIIDKRKYTIKIKFRNCIEYRCIGLWVDKKIRDSRSIIGVKKSWKIDSWIDIIYRRIKNFVASM